MPTSHNNDSNTERKIAEFQRRKMSSFSEAYHQKRPKFNPPKFMNIARRPGTRGK